MCNLCSERQPVYTFPCNSADSALDTFRTQWQHLWKRSKNTLADNVVMIIYDCAACRNKMQLPRAQLQKMHVLRRLPCTELVISLISSKLQQCFCDFCFDIFLQAMTAEVPEQAESQEQCFMVVFVHAMLFLPIPCRTPLHSLVVAAARPGNPIAISTLTLSNSEILNQVSPEVRKVCALYDPWRCCFNVHAGIAVHVRVCNRTVQKDWPCTWFADVPHETKWYMFA